jgi:hypothetical protein
MSRSFHAAALAWVVGTWTPVGEDVEIRIRPDWSSDSGARARLLQRGCTLAYCVIRIGPSEAIVAE